MLRPFCRIELYRANLDDFPVLVFKFNQGLSMLYNLDEQFALESESLLTLVG